MVPSHPAYVSVRNAFVTGPVGVSGSPQSDSTVGTVTVPEVASAAQSTVLPAPTGTCLLYTSDAADERSSVDLGGRRIIKKKKIKKIQLERVN